MEPANARRRFVGDSCPGGGPVEADDDETRTPSDLPRRPCPSPRTGSPARIGRKLLQRSRSRWASAGAAGAGGAQGPGVDVAGRVRVMSDPTGGPSARPGTMSPPAKIPGAPVIIRASTATTPSCTVTASAPRSSERVGSWPSASTRCPRRVPRASPVGWGGRSRRASIRSTVSLPSSGRLMVASHLVRTPSASASSSLELVDRHPLSGASVDDDRLLGAEPAWRCFAASGRCCRPLRGGGHIG